MDVIAQRNFDVLQSVEDALLIGFDLSHILLQLSHILLQLSHAYSQAGNVFLEVPGVVIQAHDKNHYSDDGPGDGQNHRSER